MDRLMVVLLHPHPSRVQSEFPRQVHHAIHRGLFRHSSRYNLHHRRPKEHNGSAKNGERWFGRQDRYYLGLAVQCINPHSEFERFHDEESTARPQQFGVSAQEGHYRRQLLFLMSALLGHVRYLHVAQIIPKQALFTNKGLYLDTNFY